MDVIEKTIKKAWKEIKFIQSAQNMIEVNNTIKIAMLKVFGLKDLGIQKIEMNDDAEFEKMKKIHQDNFNLFSDDVKMYLVTFIPERFKDTLMYNELSN